MRQRKHLTVHCGCVGDHRDGIEDLHDLTGSLSNSVGIASIDSMHPICCSRNEHGRCAVGVFRHLTAYGGNHECFGCNARSSFDPFKSPSDANWTETASILPSALQLSPLVSKDTQDCLRQKSNIFVSIV